MKKQTHQPKPVFIERMKLLLEDKEDLNKFLESINTKTKKSIRVNTLKISPKELIERLKTKGWKISQPLQDYPEVLIIESNLQPGELGKTREHFLGYYYVQEITSMIPIIVLSPKEDDVILDICAAPGSKTTQMAEMMKNKGTIISNDISIEKVSTLYSNIERMGITNTIITKYDAPQLVNHLNELSMKFDKILADVPCSGEGNIRNSQKILLEWSESYLKKLSNQQKQFASSALKLLKPNETMVYSTCTYAPEENEEVIQYLLDNNDIEIQEIKLPLKTRPGLTSWKGKIFSEEMKKACRIYQHDNDTEGFFICKIKKVSQEKNKK